MKHRILLALTLVLAATGLLGAQDIDRMKSQTVRIGMFIQLEGETNFRQLGSGSGYWVSDRDVVTNAHVAVDMERARRSLPDAMKPRLRAVVMALMIDDDTVIPTETVWRDDSKDLAIIRAEQPIGKPVTFADPNDTRLGIEAIVGGFPGVSDVGEAGYYDPSVTFGRINKITESNINVGGYTVRARVVQTDAPINSGNSGGPMFDACGNLIATNSFGPDNSSVGFAIHASEILSVLPRHGVTPRMATARCTGAQGVGGIDPAELERVRAESERIRRENEARNAEVARQNEQLRVQDGRINDMLASLESARATADSAVAAAEEAREAADPLKNPIVLISLAFSLLMGSAAMYLSLTKRGNIIVKEAVESGKELVTRRGPAPVLPANGPVKAVLKGVGGPLADVKLELGSEPLAIGRDPRVSHLIFPPDTEDVSKRHVLVQYQPATRTFTIEDAFSTNGTYLRSGKKLTPGQAYPLQPGEKFYLSGSGISFRVDLEAA